MTGMNPFVSLLTKSQPAKGWLHLHAQRLCAAALVLVAVITYSTEFPFLTHIPNWILCVCGDESPRSILHFSLVPSRSFFIIPCSHKRSLFFFFIIQMHILRRLVAAATHVNRDHSLTSSQNWLLPFLCCGFCWLTVLRRCVNKEKEEVLLEGMPSHYYDDVWCSSHLSLAFFCCFLVKLKLCWKVLLFWYNFH